MLRATATGIGHYLPKRIIENSYFEEHLDTSDAWIRSRSGIERRHFASDGETSSTMGIEAAKAALKNAGMNAENIDAIVVATSTPDYTFPSVASMIQAGLGAHNAFAFDVQAVCAGFVFAVNTANAMILSGQCRHVLVIGTETFSKIMDWKDRSTCVLFGDGAGALLLSAEEGEGGTKDRGILSVDIHSDGRYRDILFVDGGVATTQTTGVLRMQGKEVFRHAVEKLKDTAENALKKAGVHNEEIDWVIPHQANIRIIQGLAKKLQLGMEKVVVTVHDHGNTSAASIPLAMSVAAAEGKLKKGDVIVSEAIGGGLAWGAFVLRW